jgi:hypothetical protein
LAEFLTPTVWLQNSWDLISLAFSIIFQAKFQAMPLANLAGPRLSIGVELDRLVPEYIPKT